MATQVQQHVPVHNRTVPWVTAAMDELKVSPQSLMATSAPQASTQYTGPPYTIRTLEEDDGPQMLKFLQRFFFQDEPLNVAVQLMGPRGDEPCVPLEEYCMQSLSEPLSLAAVSPSGELLGVCLNGSAVPGKPKDEGGEGGDEGGEEGGKAESCPHPRFRKILRLLEAIEVSSRRPLADRWPHVRRLLEVRVLSVDGSRRGLGIATALLRKTKDIAREHKFPLVRCDCTSAFSARAVSKLGFEPICEIDYSTHLGEDGKPVFEPEAPHTKVATYMYEL